jgi:hypothetical protein
MVTKVQMIEAIRTLPDDATIRDAIERLELIELIEQRIADADDDPTAMITQDEVERRTAAWQP